MKRKPRLYDSKSGQEQVGKFLRSGHEPPDDRLTRIWQVLQTLTITTKEGNMNCTCIIGMSEPRLFIAESDVEKVCQWEGHLCQWLFSHTSQKVQKANLADNSLGGVECTAHHPGSRGVADIVSVTMPLLSIKDLAVAISTRAGPAEDDRPLYK